MQNADSQTPQPLTSAEREEAVARARTQASHYGSNSAQAQTPPHPYRDKTGKLAAIGELAEEILRYEATVRSLEQRCEALAADREALVKGYVRRVARVWIAEAPFSIHTTADEALQAFRDSLGVPSISSTED